MKIEKINKIIILIIILNVCAPIIFAKEKVKDESIKNLEPYIVPSTGEKIKVNGEMDESFWKEALKIEVKYEISPGDNVTPPVKTFGYIISGKENIYVAIKAYDPNPKAIRANYSDRDQIYNDDTVGVGFDTFNSGNRAFYFSANPFGIQGDTIFSLGGRSEDDAWDAIWESSGKITNYGYIVEFRIPFNAIQFSRSKEEKVWGLLFFRNYLRNKKYMISNSYISRDNDCWICQLQKVKGFKEASPGKNIEFDPTLTTIYNGVREDFPDGKMAKDSSKADLGLSGKWGIASNLNLSFAVNPDFSQIEADSAQLDINTQYALYYNEKRPFFLEGKDFFNTPLSVMYTRAVADPDFGLKLTGKFDKNAIGVFFTRDNRTNLIFPGVSGSEETSLEQKVWSSSFRYRYDLGKSSTIGVLMTDREGDNYFNRVGGLDGIIRFSESDTLTFQILKSSTLYPEEISNEFDQETDEFGGTALSLNFRHSNRNWYSVVGYVDYSPGFRADLGFIPQVNYRKGVVGGGYTFWGEKDSFFSSFSIEGDLDQTTDGDGNLVEREAQIEAIGHGPMQSISIIKFEARRYIYDGIEFDQQEGLIALIIKPLKKLRLHAFFKTGDGIDYSHVRAGKKTLISSSVSYNMNKHFELSGNFNFSNLYIDSNFLYKALLSELKLIYFINRNTFFRGIIQYTDISRNLDLYEYEVDPKTKGLFAQFLFSYKLNPRTVAYLGYSDIYNNNDQLSLIRSNMSVFLKIGYALVL